MGKREQFEYTEIFRDRILDNQVGQVAGTAVGTVVTDCEGLTFLTAQLHVTSITGTLDVYIQGSYDGGTNWVDLGHFTQMAAAGERYMTINGTGSASAEFVGSDGTLAAGTVRTVALPERLRTKAVLATGPATWSCKLIGRRD